MHATAPAELGPKLAPRVPPGRSGGDRRSETETDLRPSQRDSDQEMTVTTRRGMPSRPRIVEASPPKSTVGPGQGELTGEQLACRPADEPDQHAEHPGAQLVEESGHARLRDDHANDESTGHVGDRPEGRELHPGSPLNTVPCSGHLAVVRRNGRRP